MQDSVFCFIISAVITSAAVSVFANILVGLLAGVAILLFCLGLGNLAEETRGDGNKIKQ